MGTGRLCYNRAGLRWGRSDQVATAEGQAGWQVGKEAGWGEGRGVKSREPPWGSSTPPYSGLLPYSATCPSGRDSSSLSCLPRGKFPRWRALGRALAEVEPSYQ